MRWPNLTPPHSAQRADALLLYHLLPLYHSLSRSFSSHLSFLAVNLQTAPVLHLIWAISLSNLCFICFSLHAFLAHIPIFSLCDISSLKLFLVLSLCSHVERGAPLQVEGRPRALKTYPQQVGTIRKNDYILIKYRPCKKLAVNPQTEILKIRI